MIATRGPDQASKTPPPVQTSEPELIDYLLHLKIIRKKFRLKDFEEINYHGSTKCYRIKILKSSKSKSSWNYIVKETEEREKSSAERKLLSSINHHNIVRLLGYFRHESNDCLVFKYIRYDVQRTIKHGLKHHKKLVKLILIQVLKAIIYLHGRGIVYRDISLSNVMISVTGQVKLIDFDNAKDISKNGEAETTKGTQGFQSPEILDGLGAYNEKTDVFSVGMLAYHCYYGKSILRDQDLSRFLLLEELKTRIDQFSSRSDFVDSDEKIFHCFLKECLKIDPVKRCSAQEMFDHPWLREFSEISKEQEIYKRTKRQMRILFQSSTE